MTTGTSGFGSHAVLGAYSGPPALQNSAYATQWTLNPWVLGLVVLSAILYLVGVKRHNAVGGRWRQSQTGAQN